MTRVNSSRHRVILAIRPQLLGTLKRCFLASQVARKVLSIEQRSQRILTHVRMQSLITPCDESFVLHARVAATAMVGRDPIKPLITPCDDDSFVLHAVVAAAAMVGRNPIESTSSSPPTAASPLLRAL